MQNGQEDALRARIDKLLADGLQTRTEPFPEDNHQFTALLTAVRAIDPSDLQGKLVLSGFTNTPHSADKMRCQECMYYLIDRKWCDLPELALPVEPNWWCRLWRI